MHAHISPNAPARRGTRSQAIALALLLLPLLGGCATMRPEFEQPSVEVVSVRAVPSGDIAPQFEIGLRVINPNANELALRGLSYKLFVNDFEVVTGAASELPVVPAYGEADFKLLATVSLVDSFQLVNDLMQRSRSDLDWRLLAKLDVGALWPAIRVEEKGTLKTTTSR
jgi:LEA14-like dessication related protein